MLIWRQQYKWVMFVKLEKPSTYNTVLGYLAWKFQNFAHTQHHVITRIIHPSIMQLTIMTTNSIYVCLNVQKHKIWSVSGWITIFNTVKHMSFTYRWSGCWLWSVECLSTPLQWRSCSILATAYGTCSMCDVSDNYSGHSRPWMFSASRNCVQIPSQGHALSCYNLRIMDEWHLNGMDATHASCLLHCKLGFICEENAYWKQLEVMNASICLLKLAPMTNCR